MLSTGDLNPFRLNVKQLLLDRAISRTVKMKYDRLQLETDEEESGTYRSMDDLDVTVDTSDIVVSSVQTGPFHVEDGKLFVRTDLVIDEVEAVTWPTPVKSAPVFSWEPLKIGDRAWKDRTINQWLGDTPMHLSAQAIRSRTFIGELAVLASVLYSMDRMDDHSMSTTQRLATFSLPVFGAIAVRRHLRK